MNLDNKPMRANLWALIFLWLFRLSDITYEAKLEVAGALQATRRAGLLGSFLSGIA